MIFGNHVFRQNLCATRRLSWYSSAMRLSGSGDSKHALFHLPQEAPVMLLGGVTLFPKMLLPLFIFEMRYRAMLEKALVTDRFLIMAQPLGPEEDEVCPVAGLGLIRACVQGEDGTSNLILEGVGRVRLTGWPQLTPFRIANLESFGWRESETAADTKLRLVQLREVLEERGGDFPGQMAAPLFQIEDPDALVDIIASVLLGDSSERQRVLAEESNVRRQELLLKFLNTKL